MASAIPVLNIRMLSSMTKNSHPTRHRYMYGRGISAHLAFVEAGTHDRTSACMHSGKRGLAQRVVNGGQAAAYIFSEFAFCVRELVQRCGIGPYLR